MSETYLKLLDRAYERLPKITATGERFEIPKIVGVRVGSRTIIQNFNEISSRMNRDSIHILKFLSKEMATAGTFDGSRAIFHGKFGIESMTRLLNIYAQRFVICLVCRRPDTKMEKEGRYHVLICEACGAKSSILAK